MREEQSKVFEDKHGKMGCPNLDPLAIIPAISYTNDRPQVDTTSQTSGMRLRQAQSANKVHK